MSEYAKPYRKVGAEDDEIRLQVTETPLGYRLKIGVLNTITERPVASAELRLEGVNYLISVLERLRVQMRRPLARPRAHGWDEP